MFDKILQIYFINKLAASTHNIIIDNYLSINLSRAKNNNNNNTTTVYIELERFSIHLCPST